MILSYLYRIITGISPGIEVGIRKIYWNNISFFSKYQKTNRAGKVAPKVNFDLITENLCSRGIKKGQVIIVHSSYDLLENSGLSPEEINSRLLALVGEHGTLVMPAIRKYKEEGKITDYIIKNMDEIICTYDLKRSKVTSGFLPYMLMQREDCFISRFPLNPVVAVGRLAGKMIEHNLDGLNPSPHGPVSSWKFCVDNKAIVIGLGVDMPHYLTITHVNEECDVNWPIVNWYRKRRFEIIDGSFKTSKEVLERRPVWGTMYYAENRYRKDLVKNNIMKTETIEGLKISIIESDRLISFLRNHPRKGYPYFVRQNFRKHKPA